MENLRTPEANDFEQMPLTMDFDKKKSIDADEKNFVDGYNLCKEHMPENDQTSMVEKNDGKFYFLAIAMMIVATLMAVFYMRPTGPGGYGVLPTYFPPSQRGGFSRTSREAQQKAERKEHRRREESSRWMFVVAK